MRIFHTSYLKPLDKFNDFSYFSANERKRRLKLNLLNSSTFLFETSRVASSEQSRLNLVKFIWRQSYFRMKRLGEIQGTSLLWICKIYWKIYAVQLHSKLIIIMVMIFLCGLDHLNLNRIPGWKIKISLAGDNLLFNVFLLPTLFVSRCLPGSLGIQTNL